MEFRSAFPVAVLLGAVLGGAAAGSRDERPGSGGATGTGLVAEASAATGDARWDIPVVRNPAVERFVDLFSGKQQDRMALYLKRSGRYEGMIRGKLRERGMPEDLVYLSMIESGFNTDARSHAQAVGLWQFIEGTAERYGLRVDSYVDERRDPERATDAALRYLSDLYGQFGSWYLAAAAYNTGENRVARVMKSVTGRQKGKESDFWRIRSRLPRETREYVPLMLAAALVGKEPHKYGLEGVGRWTPLATEQVEVPAATRLATVAEAVGVSEREMRKLNPHLVRGMTPPGKKPFPVRVPEGRSARFETQFPQVLETAREREKAEAAQAAKLAAERRAEESRRAAVRREAARRSAARSVRHTVRRGESLWTIARRNGVTVRALQAHNDMGRRTKIRPGQRILIPRRAR